MGGGRLRKRERKSEGKRKSERERERVTDARVRIFSVKRDFRLYDYVVKITTGLFPLK